MKAPKPRARRTPASAPEQPVANPSRGEHELELAGVVYRLRPSRAALREIEAQAKTAFLDLARLGSVGQLTLAQLGIIAAGLIRAGAEDAATRHVSPDRLEDLIFEEGVSGVTARVTLCLVDAGTGGRDASGNAKAATA